MNTGKTPLAEISHEKMSLDDQMVWFKTMFAKGAEECEVAKQYFEDMQTYQKDMSELVQEIVEIRQNSQLSAGEKQERADDIKYAVEQVIEAMEVRKKEFVDNHYVEIEEYDLEEWENELSSGEDGKISKEDLEKEIADFLKKYYSLKTKHGFETQQEVADLTGLDRRQISRLESGKVKPQFKTLQKIALAFGVDISDLIG